MPGWIGIWFYHLSATKPQYLKLLHQQKHLIHTVVRLRLRYVSSIKCSLTVVIIWLDSQIIYTNTFSYPKPSLICLVWLNPSLLGFLIKPILYFSYLDGHSSLLLGCISLNTEPTPHLSTGQQALPIHFPPRSCTIIPCQSAKFHLERADVTRTPCPGQPSLNIPLGSELKWRGGEKGRRQEDSLNIF